MLCILATFLTLSVITLLPVVGKENYLSVTQQKRLSTVVQYLHTVGSVFTTSKIHKSFHLLHRSIQEFFIILDKLPFTEYMHAMYFFR